MLSMTRLRRNSRFHHAFQPESADRAEAAQMIISAAIDGKEKAAVHNGNLRRSPAPSLRVVARHHNSRDAADQLVVGYSKTTASGCPRVRDYNKISKPLTPAE